MNSLRLLAFAAVLVVLSATTTSALQFYLGLMEFKCFGENVEAHELVVGDFHIAPHGQGGNEVTVTVSDPTNVVVYQKESSATGKFSFTTTKEGEYRICFTSVVMAQKTVTFSLKTGVNAKDYSKVAQKDNLKPIEVQLRRLEDNTAAIHESMLFLKQREQEMRETNDSTGSRVVWFSVISIVILISLGIGQLMYLRSYFKKNKIID